MARKSIVELHYTVHKMAEQSIRMKHFGSLLGGIYCTDRWSDQQITFYLETLQKCIPQNQIKERLDVQNVQIQLSKAIAIVQSLLPGGAKLERELVAKLEAVAVYDTDVMDGVNPAYVDLDEFLEMVMQSYDAVQRARPSHIPEWTLPAHIRKAMGRARAQDVIPKKANGSEVTYLEIGNIYEMKAKADVAAVDPNQPKELFCDFVYQYFLNKFGMASLAQQNFVELHFSIHKLAKFSLKARHFGCCIGGVYCCTPWAEEQVTFFFKCLTQAVTVERIKETMDQGEELISTYECIKVVRGLFEGSPPIEHKLRAAIIQGASVNDNEADIPLDSFLDIMMSHWRSIKAFNVILNQHSNVRTTHSKLREFMEKA